MCGMPAAAITTSAWRSSAGRSTVPVCARITVALTSLRVSSSPIGPADGHAAAHHEHALAVQVDAVPAQQFHAALGGAGQRGVHGAADVGHQPAQVHRVQAVGVLGRVHGLEDDVLVDVLGQRQLDDVAGAFRVVVELAGPRPGARPGWWSSGRSRRMELMPTSAQSLCLPPTYQVLPGSEPTRMVPRPGTMPVGLERGHAFGQFGLDGGGGGLAVKDLRGCAVSVIGLPLLVLRVQREVGGELVHAGTAGPRRRWRRRPSARWR